MFQLFSKLKKENTYVAVLGTSPANEYKSETCPGDLQTPLLRALRTDPFKGTPLCPYLEQPNVLTGLAAQSKYTELDMFKRNVEWYIEVFLTGVIDCGRVCKQNPDSNGKFSQHKYNIPTRTDAESFDLIVTMRR